VARSPTLNTVTVDRKTDISGVRKALLDNFDIGCGGGLGLVAGKAWGIRLYGSRSEQANDTYLISVLEVIFKKLGYTERMGEPWATRVYAEAIA